VLEPDKSVSFFKSLREGRLSTAELPTGVDPVFIGLTEVGEGRFALPANVSLLDDAVLNNRMAQSDVRVSRCLTTGSTNLDLMDEGRHDSIHRRLHVAEHQGSGKGRRGKSWLSPLGRSLSMSIGHESTDSPNRLQGLSLVVGISVLGVLHRFGGKDCLLKWPNDVHCAGRKMCGILVEFQQVGGVGQYVIGIGINTGLTSEEMASIGQPVMNVLDAGVTVERTLLAAEVVDAVLKAVTVLQAQGFDSFRDQFDRHHSLQGKAVLVSTPYSKLEGVVRGVAADGSLRVTNDSGVHQIIAGEVSVRAIQ